MRGTAVFRAGFLRGLVLPRLQSDPHLPLLSFLTILVALLLVGCGDRPDPGPLEAEVVASVTSGQAPLAVLFTNNSRNADLFPWDFGDGTSTHTSARDDPVTHEYTQVGTYTVTLTAIQQGEQRQTSTATVIITVKPGPLDHVTIEPPATTVEITKEQQFRATALDQFDNPIPGLSYGFSSDERAGRIDSQGKLIAGTASGRYDGAVKVEVTDGSITATGTAGLTVNPGPLHRVTIEPASATVEVASQQQFTARGLDRYNNPISGLTYRFVAGGRAGRIDALGQLTSGTEAGTYEGAVRVEVAQGSVTRTATAKITIVPGPLTSVVILPGDPTLRVTEEQRFTATALDTFGNSIPGLTYSFSSDSRAGEIDDQGKFTAGTRRGTYGAAVTVEATQESVTRVVSARLTIKPGPLHHVDIRPTTPTVEASKELRFTATSFDEYDNPIRGLNHIFGSDEQAGGIDSQGKFTAVTEVGVHERAVTVEVAQGTVTVEAVAEVTVSHAPLDRVLLSPETISLNIGQTQQFIGEALDVYGNPITKAQITWDVAQIAGTISGGGLLTTATAAGTYDQGVTATAVMDSISVQASGSVTVTPDPLFALSISEVQVPAGETQQVQAVATDQYGNRVSGGQISWTILDGNAGSIDASGLLTSGEVAGTFVDAVQARATQNEFTTEATASVTIDPGPLDQVVIAPDPADIGMAMDQQFIAVGADQYGNRISGLDFAWSVETGGGTITGDGLFTAGTEPGTYVDTVKAIASQGGITRSTAASVIVEADRIAFQSDRNESQPDIYLMDVDGTNVRRLTSNAGLSPTWSADGRRIASHFCFPQDICVIVPMNDDGSWQYFISEEDGSWPSWSPDGSKIAFVSDRDGDFEIYSMDVDGGNQTRLTNIPGFADSFPTWSPDATKIAFVADRWGNDEIYVMDADGSNQSRLTTNVAADALPAWSPDGQEIVFSSDRDGDHEIYVMSGDGTGVRQLTFNSTFDGNASWSLDGSKIMFNSTRDSTGDEIYIMHADGTNVRRLTTNSFVDSSARWAPRKRGIEVDEGSMVIPNASALKESMTVQEVTTLARSAVVRVETDLGPGSGFIIDSDGLVLTNNHVISDAQQITVYLDDGSSYRGSIRGRDLVFDLALLKISTGGLPSLELGDLSQVSLGQQVAVLGFPLGAQNITVTSGFVSTTTFDRSRNILWVQTDSAINPGNSGGPLLNLQGQVIGVITAKFVGLGVEDVGFAISPNTVKLHLDRLKAGEVIP